MIWGCCNGGVDDFLYPHKFDLYTATVVQNIHGQLQRTWNLVNTFNGNVKTIKSDNLDPTTIAVYDPYAEIYTPNQFITNQVTLHDLMITNIRDVSGVQLFVEPFGDNLQTQFEIRYALPGIDVTGAVTHYIYKIVRAQEQ